MMQRSLKPFMIGYIKYDEQSKNDLVVDFKSESVTRTLVTLIMGVQSQKIKNIKINTCNNTYYMLLLIHGKEINN